MNLIQAYGRTIAPSGFLVDRGIRFRGVANGPIPTGGAVDMTRSAPSGSAS